MNTSGALDAYCLRSDAHDTERTAFVFVMRHPLVWSLAIEKWIFPDFGSLRTVEDRIAFWFDCMARAVAQLPQLRDAMLLQLEIVAWDQVQPFIKQFRKLNVTGDGRLGKNDLSVMQLASSKNLASLATHLGHRGSALTVAERSGAPSRQVTLRRSTSVPAGR